MFHGLNNEFLYAVNQITVVRTDGKDSITTTGTGFFLKKGDGIYFITNRHVMDASYSEPKYSNYKDITKVTIAVNHYDAKAKSVTVDEWELASYRLTYPKDEKDDIACLSKISRIGTNATLTHWFDFNLLAGSEQIENELSIFDSLAFIGFPGVHDHRHKTPIVRRGIISSDPRLDYSWNETYNGHIIAYEAFSTNGASGSPVFATQKGFQVGGAIKATDGFFRPIMLIGINASSIHIGSEHQHMSCLVKSDQIISLINSIL